MAIKNTAASTQRQTRSLLRITDVFFNPIHSFRQRFQNLLVIGCVFMLVQLREPGLQLCGRFIQNGVFFLKRLNLHRQFFILQQDEETLEPFPYDQETLEDFTRETVRLYNEVRSMEAAKALPGKLLELCGGDATLAKELQLYVPIAASEFFYKNLAYPETLTFDLDGQQAVVFRTQMASFYTIQKHLYWALQNKVFGKETQSIYHHLVSASPLFQFINKQEKEGHPVPDGMGMNLTISVDKDFQLR
jgi:hypothetical protein